MSVHEGLQSVLSTGHYPQDIILVTLYCLSLFNGVWAFGSCLYEYTVLISIKLALINLILSIELHIDLKTKVLTNTTGDTCHGLFLLTVHSGEIFCVH